MSIRESGRRLVLLFLWLAVGLPVSAQEVRQNQHVLFVGNSYIYYNNLHEIVEAISVALDGPRLQTEAHTHGGFSLRQHFEDGHVAAMLRRGAPSGDPWNVVVLQEQSTLGTRSRQGLLGDPADFHSAARELDALIDAAGSRSFLYMTWAKERHPAQIEDLSKAYVEAGKMTGATVAPVGLAWARVREERPDLVLFQNDGSHPSASGSYLAACVIYSQITGRTAEGAPTEISGSLWGDANTRTRLRSAAPPDGNIELVSLDSEVAHYLQRTAWEVVEKYLTN